MLEVATGEVLDGPVDRVRYSPVAWLPGGTRFFYVRRLPPEEVPPGEEAYHRRLWLHQVGDDPGGDVEVFGRGIDKTAYLGVTTSHDGRWATVTVNLGTAPRNDVYVADLVIHDPGLPVWQPVLEGVDAQAWPYLDRRGHLWVLTDFGAPRRRLCVTDPTAPSPEGWVEVVGEDPGVVLEGFCLAGDAVVVARSRHTVSEVALHDRASGQLRSAVALPGPGTVDLTGRPDEGPEAWVGYTDWVTPYEVHPLDVATGTLAPSSAAPSGEQAVVRQVTYRSADGPEVGMSLVAPPGRLAGARPTVLYGYGGFGVAIAPAYSSTIAAWVAAGGVWGVAHLRGGSEEGEDWHRAGTRQDKHHVFEDLEAAASWLVAEGVTTAGGLGIFGGSNGGLLVGAALTRQPGRYRAVVCSAPLLDMVRYERFGLGATWRDEYGRASAAAELEWLLGYSPYHHVSPGTVYPAVLFTVFDGDTRVDPLHARKMAAALQWATNAGLSERPVLLRREPDVGHGARAMSRAVALLFLAVELGLDIAG